MYIHVIFQHITYNGSFYIRSENLDNGEVVWKERLNNQGVMVEGKFAKELEVVYKVKYVNKGIFPNSNFQSTVNYHKKQNEEI